MSGRSLAAAAAAALLALVAAPAAAGATTVGEPSGTLSIGSETVEFDDLIAEPGDDGTYRTMYFAAGDLVAAAWDRSGDGRHDLWFRVDADWYVDLQAVDDDADGRADRIWSVDRDGTTTALAVDGGTGVGLAVAIGLATAVVAGVLAGFVLVRRRRGRAARVATTAAVIALVLPVMIVVPPPAHASIYDDDCVIDATRFDAEWEKYSDIGSDLPTRSLSPEAQRATLLTESVELLLVDTLELQLDVDWEREELAELREYREALVRDIRRNLVRSFIRLSILTYSTTKSGLGLRQSVERLMTSSVTLQIFGAAVNIVRNFQPALDDHKASVRGALVNVGWDGLVDAMESLGKTESVVSATAQSVINQFWELIPSVDLDEAEIEILREQHLGRNDVDQMMLEAERRIMVGRDLIARNDAEITRLSSELLAARSEEKERVHDAIRRECERLRERRERAGTDLDDDRSAPSDDRDPVGSDESTDGSTEDDALDPDEPDPVGAHDGRSDEIDELVGVCSANGALDLQLEVTSWLDGPGGYAELYGATLSITNLSEYQVQLGLHLLDEHEISRDLWTLRQPLDGGDVRELSIMADYNAGRSGIATWSLVPHVLAYWDDPACLAVYDALSPADLAAVAIEVPNPFPYGP